MVSRARIGERLGHLWRLIRGGPLTPARAGWSVGLGLFVGLQPVFGLHLPLCLAGAYLLRLDGVVAYAAANVSNPLLAPVILVAELKLGSWLTAGSTTTAVGGLNLSTLAAQGLLGALLLGSAAAVLGGLTATGVLRCTRARRNRGKIPADNAHPAKTLCRYATSPRPARYYVACKLRLDPILESLLDLEMSFGKIVDLGCGRGQLGLALVDLGRACSVVGIDWDAAKIQTAQRAAGPDGTYAVANLLTCSIPAADTLLLVDVLHYLPCDAQDTLLRRAVGSLAVGGRLVIRESDRGQSMRSLWSRWFETIGVRLGINRGDAFHFRSIASITERLGGLGLSTMVVGPRRGTWLANVLIVATRTAEALVAPDDSLLTVQPSEVGLRRSAATTR